MEEIQGVCIPGGVDIENFKPDPDKVEGRKLLVGFYSRLGDGRGIEHITRVAKILKDHVTFIGFDAIGYPSLEVIPGSGIVLVTTRSQLDLRRVYQKCDIVLSFMRSAGWNNVVGEGMACGAVPIATVHGTKDLIQDGKTGFLCSDANIIHDAVDRILYLSSHRDRLREMSKAAAQRVQQFSWANHTAKVLEEIKRRL